MAKFAILFCALLAISYVQARRLRATSQNPIDNLVKDIKKFHSGTVKRQIADYKELAADTLETIRKKSSDVTNDVYQGVADAIKAFDKKVKQYKRPAGKKNVNDCLELQDGLHNDGLLIIASMSNCITAKIDEGYKYVEKVNKYSDELEEVAKDLKKKAAECLTSGTTDCYETVKQEFTTAVRVTVPELVKKLSTEANLVSTIIPTVTECSATESIDKFISSTQPLLEQFQQCIQKHL